MVLNELTGNTFLIESTPATIETEIDSQHHSFVMGHSSGPSKREVTLV